LWRVRCYCPTCYIRGTHYMRFFRTLATIDQHRDIVSGNFTIDNIRFLMLNCFFSLSSYLTSSLFTTKVKVLVFPTLPDCRSSIAFRRRVWSIGGMKLAWANRSTPRQTCHSGTLPSTVSNRRLTP